jgi:hypothetical protein
MGIKDLNKQLKNEDFCPDAYVQGIPLSRIYVEDFMTRFHSLGNNPMTGDELYHQFMHVIRSCLMKGKLIGDWEVEDRKEQAQVGRCIYVVIADIPERVPKNKLHEQRKRDEQKKKRMEMKKIEPYPEDWIICDGGIKDPTALTAEKINMERFHCSGRPMRRRLYQYLIQRFKFESLPSNCEVWFDLLTEESTVFRCPEGKTETEQCKLEVPFVRAGEAEVACIQYMKHFYKDELRLDESLTLVTTDTDVLAMAVANTYYERRPLLMWWNVIGGATRKDGFVWVDRVVGRLKAKRINVMGFLGVCALMGCDYLDKSILFSGIGSDVVWKALIPVVRDQAVNGRFEWFSRFVRAVYEKKRENLKEDTALMCPPDKHLKEKAFVRWVWTLTYWATLDPGPNVHDGLEGRLEQPPTLPALSQEMSTELVGLGEGRVEDDDDEVVELENGKWHGKKKTRRVVAVVKKGGREKKKVEKKVERKKKNDEESDDDISSSEDLTDYEDEVDKKRKKERVQKTTVDKRKTKKYKLDLIKLFE